MRAMLSLNGPLSIVNGWDKGRQHYPATNSAAGLG
jgi:hypothetical protein